MSTPNKGAFYAALSGLFFGLIGYFGISAIKANISVNNMLFWRFLVSAFFILIFLLPQIKTIKISFKEILKVSISGALFYGVCSTLYFIASEHIGSGLAMVIFFTYPAIVMLINFLFYKNKIGKLYFLALSIILIGMVCLIQGGSMEFNLLGIGLSILSAFLYALYIISNKNSPAPPLFATFLVSLGAAISCLIAALYEQTFIVPTGWNVWFNIAGIGILCTALPMLLLLKGLKYISAVQASILSVMEPVFVVIFGILLLGETINLTQAMGIVILLTGALLALLSPRYEGKNE